MTTSWSFWLYAGLLCVAALAFVLVPQLRPVRRRVDANRVRLNVGVYRERLRELEAQHDSGMLDAAQFQGARAEAALELLDDAQGPEPSDDGRLGRAIPLVAALSAPVLALVLYLHWGSLDQLVLAREHGGQSAQNIEEITTRLEELLSTRPESAEGWSLLGRAYMAEERAIDAVHAYERAATLAGRPAELLGHWAEALYIAGDRHWTPQVQALTDEALAGNPQEAISLRLVGIAAFQAGRYAEAAAYWERLMATLPEGDPGRAVIAEDIARARDSIKGATAQGAQR